MNIDNAEKNFHFSSSKSFVELNNIYICTENKGVVKYLPNKQIRHF